MKNSIKITVLFFVLFVSFLNSFSQVKELENFRKHLTLFINYDNGKIDSIKKSEENTFRMNNNMEEAFLKFVYHPNSRSLETLKQNGQNDGKNNYWFDKLTYSFASLNRNLTVKSKENNVDYLISFPGLYDYKLSNFVSFYIQPFLINKTEYIVYYYKLNGKGKYFIKQVDNNKIVFFGEALTSNAPIISLNEIDKNHFLLIEDVGERGQRAMVLKSNKKTWSSIEAFKGQAFISKDPKSEKVFLEKRKYLLLLSTKTINSHLSFGYLKRKGLKYNNESLEISYEPGNNSESIIAKWKNNMFLIDDYYLGGKLNDEPLPFPD